MAKQRLVDYDISVFINCPFDAEYKYLFDALIFAVHDCGFIARCALEIRDVSRGRIDKIFEIVSECRFGIHDISRTELDAVSQLPRFNMPLELGIFLAAKYFGSKSQQNKICLVMDRDEHRYQKFCSDLKGYDIDAHKGDVRTAVIRVRDWLRTEGNQSAWLLPSGSRLFERYREFLRDLPALCDQLNLDSSELIFADYTKCCAAWLSRHPRDVERPANG
jgi:hypothetical protein